jgi:ABC-type phosphate transport system substrate-binding protein
VRVNASRAIKQAELEACRAAGREPLELRVGTDALAVVVSRENSFLQNATIEQLGKIFAGGTEAVQSWREVDPAWPDAPIKRFIPGQASGTLDFFVESVFPGQLAELSKAELTAILEANVSKGLMRRFEKDQPFAERTQENIYALVVERVVERKIVKSWTLSESLLQRSQWRTNLSQLA